MLSTISRDTNMNNKTRMKPPLTKLRIGDMFGSENSEVVGFIKALSINVPDEGVWETSIDQEAGTIATPATGTTAALPKYLILSISYQVIHSSSPSLEMVYRDADEKFYGGSSNTLFPLDTK